MKAFFYSHSLLPLVLIMIATLSFSVAPLDLLVSDAIYAAQDFSWQMKSSWLLERLIHKGGRHLVALLVLINLAIFLSTWLDVRIRPYRLGLGYLLAATMTSMLIISGLKGITHIDCPWSYQRYGGDLPYATITSMIFGSGTGRCFPAGHASGGYAWVALYFVCDLYRPQWRRPALALGLMLGLVFGLAQQIRGAHFLSHDLTTLAICWYTSLAGYYWLSLRHPAILAKYRGSSQKPACYNCDCVASWDRSEQ